MVTLEGDLMESSGAMIGGFRSRSKGIAFKEKESREELALLETEVSRLEQALSTIEKNREINEENIQKLRERKAILEVDIMKLEKLSNNQDLQSLQKKHKELKSSVTELTSSLQNIDEDIASLQRELSNLKERKQKSKSTNIKELSSL